MSRLCRMLTARVGASAKDAARLATDHFVACAGLGPSNDANPASPLPIKGARSGLQTAGPILPRLATLRCPVHKGLHS
jgi:hypothetical protein